MSSAGGGGGGGGVLKVGGVRTGEDQRAHKTRWQQ